MKNLKMIQAAVAAAVIMLAGCNEHPTSSGESYKESSDKGAIEVQEQTDRPSIKTRLTLKSNEVYTFNLSNTGFSNFYSIKAARVTTADLGGVSNSCTDILVFSLDSVNKYDLSCNSSNFNLSNISIKNTSKSLIRVDVTLVGKKAVKSMAVDNEKFD